jgi:hypothetical protein
LGRYINPEGAGKERTRLSKTVVLALRELMRQTETGDASRDLAAYIAIALRGISRTVEESVAAWEKKDYWVKADRYRMEWEWAGRMADRMEKALYENDWAAIAMTAAQVGQKLMKV